MTKMRPLTTTSVENAEIFYSIRLEDRKGSSFSRRAWRAYQGRLSSNHARRCVWALLNNDILKKALDPLLDMPGMRTGLMISTMHKLIEAKAPEEAKAYLDHTYATWIRIVGTREAAKKVESADVQALELRCPRFCTGDAEFIAKKVEQGDIFRNFSKTDRDNILKELLDVETIITSLRTFSQDIHLLEACAASMRHIVQPGRHTIRTMLMDSFKEAGTQAPQSDRRDDMDSSPSTEAIQELWTFMLRNFQDMPSPTTRKTEKSLAGPRQEKSHRDTVLRSAQHALQLGFQTREAQQLASVGTEKEQQGGNDAIKPKNSRSRLSISSLSDGVLSALVIKHSVERLERRCGRPKDKTFQTDRMLLTRENLLADFKSLQVQGPEISSFFVLRCQHYAFFRPTQASPDCPTLPVTSTIEGALEPPPPAEVCHISPPTIEQSIREWRAVSEESEYTDASLPTDSTRQSIVPAKEQGGPPSESVQVFFKEFTNGQFHTIKQVDAGEAETTAQQLLSDHVLLSDELHFLLPRECVEAAKTSGIDTIVVLSRKNIKRDLELKKAVRQLKMVANTGFGKAQSDRVQI